MILIFLTYWHTNVSPKVINKYLGRTIMHQFYRAIAYLSDADIRLVQHALDIATKAHAGQTRQSGEPYIVHPVAVTILLAGQELGAEVLCAGLLHDVLEDTEVTKKDLSEQGFSDSIISLVEGVTKIDKLQFNNIDDAQAHNLQKLVMAMAKDARVIVIKLADRIHNLSTISSLKPKKQQKIAKESQQVFIPIAGKLGMNRFKVRMEKLCMQVLHPWRFNCIERAIKKNSSQNQQLVNQLTDDFLVELNKNNINVCIQRKEKTAFQIYEAMLRPSNSAKDVLKINDLCIITENQDDCYRVLGIAHNYFRYLPGKFKDYIAQPKINGYQAIHKKLMTEQGEMINLQVLSTPMLDRAELGIVSYWKQDCPVNRNIECWFHEILASKQHTEDAKQFVQQFKSELSETDVYALTPKGQVIALPKGASLIDFAYAVHSELGSSLIGGQINNQWVDNQYIVKMGDVIEVISHEIGTPSCLWLQWCKTTTAINQIKSWLHKQSESEALVLGKKVLCNYLDLKDESDVFINACRHSVKNNGLESCDELYTVIGYARKDCFALLNQIATYVSEQSNSSIENQNEQTYGLATCCYPLPEDKAVKIFSSKGSIIHRQRCYNTHKLERIPFNWHDYSGYDVWVRNVDFTAGLYLQLRNHPGALAEVTATIASLQSNIRDITTQPHAQSGLVKIVISIRDRFHLSQLMKLFKSSEQVLSIRRV